ncbi:MAG: NAD(P)H-binding protein [Candidatus Marinimicrobia bacterium]|nr:NAD(P)H-binding protein [Candidatus Neomarinimicrobiota bacterium]
MNILLLGATGRTGNKVIEHAKKRGHAIAAVARNPEDLNDFQLNIIPGTPYDNETIAQAITGCDAVINTLNVSRKSDNPWSSLTAPKDLISKAGSNAVQAMKKEGIKRFITLSTIGAGSSWDSLPGFMKLLVKFSNLKYAFTDHSRQEEMLAESDADFTVCRAPMLSDEMFDTEAVVTFPDEKPAGMYLGRDSAAEFFIRILEQREYLREFIHLSNKKRTKQ